MKNLKRQTTNKLNATHRFDTAFQVHVVWLPILFKFVYCLLHCSSDSQHSDCPILVAVCSQNSSPQDWIDLTFDSAANSGREAQLFSSVRIVRSGYTDPTVTQPTSTKMAQCLREKIAEKVQRDVCSEACTLSAARGPHQAGAEKLIQAVHGAPSVWTKHWFFAFSSFQILIGGCITPKYVEFINEVTEQFFVNEGEPAHFRALLLFVLLIVYPTRVSI